MVVTSTPPEYVQSMALLLERVAGTSSCSAGVIEQSCTYDQRIEQDPGEVQSYQQQAAIFEWKTENAFVHQQLDVKGLQCVERKIPTSWESFISADSHVSSASKRRVGNKRKVERHHDDDESPLKRSKNEADFHEVLSLSSPRDLNDWFEHDCFVETLCEDPFDDISPPMGPQAGEISPDSSDEDFDCGFLTLADVSQDQLLQSEAGVEEDSIEDIVKRAMCQDLCDSDTSSAVSTPDMVAELSLSPTEQRQADNQHDLRMYENMINQTFNSLTGTPTTMMPPSPMTPYNLQAFAMFVMPAPSKQLVCSGVIQRKNKKSQPGDSYQLKWKLK